MIQNPLILGAQPMESIPSGDMRGEFFTSIWMDGESIQMQGKVGEGTESPPRRAKPAVRRHARRMGYRYLGVW